MIPPLALGLVKVLASVLFLDCTALFGTQLFLRYNLHRLSCTKLFFHFVAVSV